MTEIRKSNEAKKLAKYALDYGKWLGEKADKNGKVLDKNLSIEDQLKKQEQEMILEQKAFHLDANLTEEKINTEPYKRNAERYNKLIKVISKLYSEYKKDASKNIQKELIEKIITESGVGKKKSNSVFDK